MRNIVFKIFRFFVRGYIGRYSVSYSNKIDEPAVYVVHHQNLSGPTFSLAWFDVPMRLWALNVFCNWRTCFSQYYDYTFTKRFGMPKVIAAIVAFPVSLAAPILMWAINAIPVYRGTRDIVKTFRQTVSSLTHGQSILICPDVDYVNKGQHMGEMYDGFLDLERYYIKESGRHLAFAPLYISRASRCVYQGDAVYFGTEKSFKQEKVNVYNRLKQELLDLEAHDKGES